MELAAIALGFVLVTMGSGAVMLAAGYWRTSGVTLLSFGLFACLYGGRLVITTPTLGELVGLSTAGQSVVTATLGYWLPVPGLVFLEQQRGPGWHVMIRRLWQAWIGLAGIFTGVDVVAGTGAAARPASALVIVLVGIVLAHVVWWKPARSARGIWTVGLVAFVSLVLHDNLVGLGLLPWALSLEGVGLGAFILSLGFITAQQVFANQREITTMEYELKTASAIQAGILPDRPPAVAGLDIAVRYIPMRSVAGDMYDFVAAADRGLGTLVADVTGHGVPAALIASMAKVAFTSQAGCADQPGTLLAGMNRALCGHLERQFVTAIYLHVDATRRVVRYSNAGHPPALVWQPGPQQVVALEGGGLFMGFDPDASYPTGEMPLSRGDRLVVYTDGVIEVTRPDGAFFERPGLEALIRDCSHLAAEPFADALLDHLALWSGHGVGGSFEDDVTLVVIDVTG